MASLTERQKARIVELARRCEAHHDMTKKAAACGYVLVQFDCGLALRRYSAEAFRIAQEAH